MQKEGKGRQGAPGIAIATQRRQFRMETKVLKIEGMSCDHCKKAVAEALQGIAGVKSVEVDLEAGKATVSYDPAQASEEVMRRAVEEAGYEVVAS